MKHPTDEQWMEFLYEEVSPEEARQMQGHLEVCEVCRQRTAGWQSTMKHLDQWKVEAPAQTRLLASWGGGWKWAAAACLILTSAFAAGRLSGPNVDVAAIREEISKPLQETIEARVRERLEVEVAAATERAMANVREKLNAQIAANLQKVSQQASADAMATTEKQLQQFSATLATLREEDRKTLMAAFQGLEAKRLADMRNLRQELETVAVLTDRSLRSAQRQLVQLASYTQATE